MGVCASFVHERVFGSWSIRVFRPEPHSVRSASCTRLLNKIEQKLCLPSGINKQLSLLLV